MSAFTLKKHCIVLALLGCCLQLVLANTQLDPPVCPKIGETYIGDERLDTKDPVKRVGEVSGIALSPTQVGPSGAPVLFATGDGGAQERIGLWDSGTGERLMTLVIDNSTLFNKDWEALTIGSCGNTGPTDSCLYVMDAGDNTARASGGRRGRKDVPYSIIKIREPNLDDFQDQDYIPETYFSILEYDYLDPSSPTDHADCEAMFMDHGGFTAGETIGDLYLATKWAGPRGDVGAHKYRYNRLFYIPTTAWPDSYCASVSQYRPAALGSYEFTLTRNSNGNTITDPITEELLISGGQIMGREWRSGEMSFDGTLIALGDVQDAYLFPRCPGVSVVDALAAPNATTVACAQWPHPSSGQVEAFTFYPDGSRGLNVPEGGRPRLGWTELIYDASDTTHTCEASSPTIPQLQVPSKDTLEVCPTPAPTTTFMPSASPAPTLTPTTGSPSASPAPTFEGQTAAPSQSPTQDPTQFPTLEPTTSNPTLDPTMVPSVMPTTAAPTISETTLSPTSFDDLSKGTTLEPTDASSAFRPPSCLVGATVAAWLFLFL